MGTGERSQRVRRIDDAELDDELVGGVGVGLGDVAVPELETVGDRPDLLEEGERTAIRTSDLEPEAREARLRWLDRGDEDRHRAGVGLTVPEHRDPGGLGHRRETVPRLDVP